uniref:Uncharacterized protein n=1 Tax=Arundo donax TaxID=35708 RepID=A0A0A9BPX2_ARUDO
MSVLLLAIETPDNLSIILCQLASLLAIET